MKSGDAGNLEARAAAYYWRNFFKPFPALKDFTRDRDGTPPNNLLNYGYAILRAVVARALVSSGLLPTLGIHHHNRYNAFCLADDMMEPYRPFVDQVVFGEDSPFGEAGAEKLTRPMKACLLQVLTCDVKMGELKRPLMVALTYTAASLARYYLGTASELSLPTFP